MSERLWFVVGGPAAGKWMPAGLTMYYPATTTKATYASVFGIRAVAVPAAPVVYVPALIQVPGWVVPLPVWTLPRIAQGLQAITFNAPLPGGNYAVPRPSVPVCRWCFKPSFGELGVCLMRECVSVVGWIESLDAPGWQASS
jgi:hypothetical protein